MVILAVLFWVLVVFTVVAIVLGACGKPRWYWWAALSAYICSFLSGFSIGLFVLSLSFILVCLALGHTYKLIRAWWHSAAATVLGVALWWLAVTSIDDYWLFLPFAVFDLF